MGIAATDVARSLDLAYHAARLALTDTPASSHSEDHILHGSCDVPNGVLSCPPGCMLIELPMNTSSGLRCWKCMAVRLIDVLLPSSSAAIAHVHRSFAEDFVSYSIFWPSLYPYEHVDAMAIHRKTQKTAF